MARTEYEKGSSIKVFVDFTDPDNDDAPINPTTVTLDITAPDGTAVATAGSITNPSAGRHEYVLLLEQANTYRWKWTGTSGAKVVVVPGSCDSVDSGR